MCSNPAKPDGSACSDNSMCTQNDTCETGVCTAGNPVVCVASDQCHAAGVCDPASGSCSNPALADGTPCDDRNICTAGDSCQSGTCAGAPKCDPTLATCDPTSGLCCDLITMICL
jgi:hypothetical protein